MKKRGEDNDQESAQSLFFVLSWFKQTILLVRTENSPHWKYADFSSSQKQIRYYSSSLIAFKTTFGLSIHEHDMLEESVQI